MKPSKPSEPTLALKSLPKLPQAQQWVECLATTHLPLVVWHSSPLWFWSILNKQNNLLEENSWTGRPKIDTALVEAWGGETLTSFI